MTWAVFRERGAQVKIGSFLPSQRYRGAVRVPWALQCRFCSV